MNFPVDVEKRIVDWYKDSSNKDRAIENGRIYFVNLTVTKAGAKLA